MREYSSVLSVSEGWREGRATEVFVGGVAKTVERERHGREGGVRCSRCESRAGRVDRLLARRRVRGRRGVVAEAERAVGAARRSAEVLARDVDWSWEREEQGQMPDGWTWEGRERDRELAGLLRGSETEAREAEEELGRPVEREGERERYARRCPECAVFEGRPGNVGKGTRWHEAREDAWRGKARRVALCGSETVEVRCRCCGHSQSTRPVGCGAHLVCAGCRKARARREEQRIRRLVDGLGEAAGEAGCIWTAERTRVSRWRLVTLPVPHVGTKEFRSRVISRAWPRFLRAMNEFLKERAVVDGARLGVDSEELRAHWHWIRKGEVTPGDDGEGHWHFHVLAHGPFLEQREVVRWWREALAGAGLPWREYGFVGADGEARGPVCDVRAVRDDDVAKEVAKYVAKEFSVERAMTAELVSEVWRWASGTRTAQCSAGLTEFAPAVVQACSSCGAARCVPRRVVVPARPVELGGGGVARLARRGVDVEVWWRASRRYREAVRARDAARDSAVFVAVLSREKDVGT